MLKKLVSMCILAVVMCPVVNATQIISSDFSIGIGYTMFRGWDTYETSAVNTSSTQGDFTFSPTVTGIMGSGGGWFFPNRVPTGNGANGGVGYDDPANPWVMTLNGSYNGVAQTGGILTINITGMSIYGSPWAGVGHTFWFTETTSDHTAVSPSVATPQYVSHMDPATYAQLIWNPTDFAVAGESATRTFGIDESSIGYMMLDGFEIYGNVTYEYIPEPATMILLSLGGLLIRKR
jgi:hypothetical protein